MLNTAFCRSGGMFDVPLKNSLNVLPNSSVLAFSSASSVAIVESVSTSIANVRPTSDLSVAISSGVNSMPVVSAICCGV